MTELTPQSTEVVYNAMIDHIRADATEERIR